MARKRSEQRQPQSRQAKPATRKTVEALRYRREEATRKNIPTAEYQSVMESSSSA